MPIFEYLVTQKIASKLHFRLIPHPEQYGGESEKEQLLTRRNLQQKQSQDWQPFVLTGYGYKGQDEDTNMEVFGQV